MIVVGSHPAHEVNLNGRLSLREYLHNALPDIQGGGRSPLVKAIAAGVPLRIQGCRM